MVDFNCFSGNWPFHKVRNNTFEKIRKAHLENGVNYGYISSLESIFYNDFYESEEELYNTVKNTNYKQVITINPMLEGCANSVLRCIKEFDVAGIRLLPGFHNYTLDSEVLAPILKIAKEYKLPIFLTLRMEDERVLYMLKTEPVKMEDVVSFIEKNADITILLCNIRINEIFEIKDAIINNPKVFCDTCGLKGWIFNKDKIGNVAQRIVYGSSSPLFALKSTILFVEKGVDDDEIKDKIKSGENFILSLVK